MKVASIFASITAVLGLIADIITIITYFSAVTPAPASSNFSLSTTGIVALSFTLFYGWLILIFRPNKHFRIKKRRMDIEISKLYSIQLYIRYWHSTLAYSNYIYIYNSEGI